MISTPRAWERCLRWFNERLIPLIDPISTFIWANLSNIHASRCCYLCLCRSLDRVEELRDSPQVSLRTQFRFQNTIRERSWRMFIPWMTQSRGIIWLDPVICRDLPAFQPPLARHLALILPPRVRFRMTVSLRQNRQIRPASAPNVTSD